MRKPYVPVNGINQKCLQELKDKSKEGMKEWKKGWVNNHHSPKLGDCFNATCMGPVFPDSSIPDSNPRPSILTGWTKSPLQPSFGLLTQRYASSTFMVGRSFARRAQTTVVKCSCSSLLAQLQLPDCTCYKLYANYMSEFLVYIYCSLPCCFDIWVSWVLFCSLLQQLCLF